MNGIPKHNTFWTGRNPHGYDSQRTVEVLRSDGRFVRIVTRKWNGKPVKKKYPETEIALKRFLQDFMEVPNA